MPTTPFNRDSVMQVATDAVVTDDTVPSGDVLKMPHVSDGDPRYDTDFPVGDSPRGMSSYSSSLGDDSVMTLGYQTASSQMIPVPRPPRVIRMILIVLIILLAMMTITGAFLAQKVNETVAGIRYDKLEAIEVTQAPAFPKAEELLSSADYIRAQREWPDHRLELGKLRIQAFMQRENRAAAANEARDLLHWARIRGQTGAELLHLATIANTARDHRLSRTILNSISWDRLSPAQTAEAKALLGRLKEFHRR